MLGHGDEYVSGIAGGLVSSESQRFKVEAKSLVAGRCFAVAEKSFRINGSSRLAIGRMG